MFRWVRDRVRLSRRYVGLHESRPLVQSFNFAFEGVIHTLATQRNMRIHFIAAAVAMFACLALGVTRVELILVIFAASFRDSKRPDVDFGSNVAGIILGGLSEQLSLIIGFKHLIFVAIGYYLVSFVLKPRLTQVAAPAIPLAA